MLHCLGPAVQRIYRTLPGKNDTCKAAIEALEDYFAPKRNVVAERYKFRSRSQNIDESIDAYLASLRELAKTCEFGELEDEMLRDQIVEKCHSKRLKERLLAQDDLDLVKTVKIARSSENAIKETRLLSGAETKDLPININRLDGQQNLQQKKSCYRCGDTGHRAAECRALNKKCNNCQKQGHLARVCRSNAKPRKQETQRTLSKKNGYKAKGIRAIRSKDYSKNDNKHSDESDSEEEFVLCVGKESNRVQVVLNGRKIKMIADTGCKQNIISSQLYNEQFKSYPLEKTTKRFLAYGQQTPLTCWGRFKASLKAGMRVINSYVYVIQGQVESLLGRQSCLALEIYKEVKHVKQTNFEKIEDPKLNSLLKEYDDIFHGLGQITNYAHKIKIDPDVKPVSQRLRRIPFSQLDKVDAEIDKLLNDDVIEETPEPSPWVSNLVIVPKPSGDLRVCCDYRDLNKAIIRERFILPKVEDTLHALQGSKYLAKIDAKNGFLQLNLSEECRYLTTFITNKGCFQFKRVPFGLSDISETF